VNKKRFSPEERKERKREQDKLWRLKNKEVLKERRRSKRLKEKPDEVTKLLQSIDEGGSPSFITSNLRRISQNLNVKILKSDKPSDVINNIRTANTPLVEVEK
jgi:tRNA U34 5-carboxymethylaminomethyl modifying GTPase MnmE/TrmE